MNLRRIARCINQGGLRDNVRPLAYVCLSTDPDALKVAKAYQSVPESYRRLLPPEAFCQAAGVSPYRVLEIITGIAMRSGAWASTVLASAMLPHVVQKIIDRAHQKEGFRERKLLMQVSGLLGPRD
jgi:hypothetical protein